MVRGNARKAVKSAATLRDRLSRSTWRYFEKCFGWGCDPQSEPNEQSFSPATRNYDAETEQRIKKWILDCSICHGQKPESSSQCDLVQNMSDVSTECSLLATGPAKTLQTKKISTATVNNKARNKNRWKGRLPSDDQAGECQFSLSANALNTSPPTQAVRTKLRVLPPSQPPTSPMSSRIIFANEPYQ